MHVNWAAVAGFGLRVISTIVPQVAAVEQLSKAIPVLTGKAKEDAVVLMAKEALDGIEAVSGRSILNEPAVEVAARAFIQAYVALQNVIAATKADQTSANQTGNPLTSDPVGAQ